MPAPWRDPRYDSRRACHGTVTSGYPRPMRRRTAGLAVAIAALAWAAPAQAGDPIMPLSQVHRGMHCTGYSVVQGTDISSFHADVIDVVSAGGSDTGEPAILIQASGPAV